MRTMKASEFKAKCLQVLDEVEATGEPVQVTKRGVVVAELRPAAVRPETSPWETFQRLFPKGSVMVSGPPLGAGESPWDEFGGAGRRIEDRLAEFRDR